MRLFFILVNAAIVVFGTAWVEVSLPFVTALLMGILVWVVFGTQKRIWDLDMERKRDRQKVTG